MAIVETQYVQRCIATLSQKCCVNGRILKQRFIIKRQLCYPLNTQTVPGHPQQCSIYRSGPFFDADWGMALNSFLRNFLSIALPFCWCYLSLRTSMHLVTIVMHDAYIGGRSENNIKCVVVHNDLGRKNRTARYNCRSSAASLALRVIFSVSQLWNIFDSFTEPFNYIAPIIAQMEFCALLVFTLCMCHILFTFCHLFVGRLKGHPACKKSSVGLLVVTT